MVQKGYEMALYVIENEPAKDKIRVMKS